MSGEKKRVAPQPNVYVPTQPFWDGVRDGKLVLQYCKDTNQFQHYPRPVSIFTGSRNLEWRQVSGRGEIYACTTLRISGPGLEGRVPLAVATVELEEKVRLIANIVDSDPASIRIGARVRLAWDRIDDNTNYPAFVVV